MKIEGTLTALVTPMRDDLSVDFEGLRKNVEFQISEGIDGVLPVGTSGESPTLSHAEHNDVVKETVKAAAKRCRVLAGCGSNSTAEMLKSTAAAHENGADASLMVDCYYNGPSSEELMLNYYAPAAEAFPDMSFVPYVIPGRTGTELTAVDLAVLAGKYPNIRTVKEATGNIERMKYERKLLGDDFSILSGDDDLTFTLMTDPEIRANGVISVISNIFPGALVKMVNLIKSGDVAEAEKIKDKIAPLLCCVTVKAKNVRTLPSGEKVETVDRYRNPLPIKTLMSMLGLPAGACHKPLGTMSAEGVRILKDAAVAVWNNDKSVYDPMQSFYNIDVEKVLFGDK